MMKTIKKTKERIEYMDKKYVGVFVLAILVLSMVFLSAGTVHASTIIGGTPTNPDTILSPLNNSHFAYGQNITLTFQVSMISASVPYDLVGIYVGQVGGTENLYYEHNYSANGVYSIPIQFLDYQNWAVALKSTGNQNATVTYYYSTAPNVSTEPMTFGGLSLPWWLWIIIAVIGLVFIIGVIKLIIWAIRA